MNNNQKLIALLKEQVARKDLRDIIAVSDGPCENDRIVSVCVDALLQEYDYINDVLGAAIVQQKLASAQPKDEGNGKVSERDELREEMCHLAHDISDVRVELVRATEVLRSASCFATKMDLEKLENKIMSVISDYLGKQKAWNQRQEGAVDSIVSSVTGLTGDVDELNRKILALQNSPGTVTPEDAAMIDELQTRGEALATKAEGVASALKILDESTPPVVPPAPPV